jgi:S1-C subfamily serine protease
MPRAIAILGLLAVLAAASAVEDRFPTPEQQAESFVPFESAMIDGVPVAHWLASRKALLLTGVQTVTEHGGGAASVHNEGFACAAHLTDDGYLLTVQHAVREPVMALRRAVGRADLKSARVVWSGDANGCDLTVLKVDWSDCCACRWAPEASIAPGARVLAAGCYLAEDEQHQWFRDDRSAGAVAKAPRRTDAAGHSPAFAIIEAALLVHPGDSGGPVLTAEGELIGLTMAHLLDPRTGESTGATLVIRPDTAFLDRVIGDDRSAREKAQERAEASASVAPGK